MWRSKAKRTFTLVDLAAQTAGVECPMYRSVLDEIPGAHKNLEFVIEAQTELVGSSPTTLMCVRD